MRYSDLPTSKCLGTATNEQELVKLLIEITENSNKPFLYFDIIEGSDRSGRMFFQEKPPPSSSAVEMPRPFITNDLAKELFKSDFMKVVRYAPSDRPDKSNGKKGWEIHSAQLEGKLVVIVWAAWI
jgi:hypothetical protein